MPSIAPNRRRFLAGSTAALAAPAIVGRARAADVLNVSSYGGTFEDTLRLFIYPIFTQETGIEVNSVA